MKQIVYMYTKNVGSQVIVYDKVCFNGLCHIVTSTLHMTIIVNSKQCGFNGMVYKLISTYGFIQPDILCKLFGSFCCSC